MAFLVGLALLLVTAAPLEPPLTLGQSQLTTALPLGLGTWSWGNRLLYSYDPQQDPDISAAYRAARAAGISYFDTGDSYGTGSLEVLWKANGKHDSLTGMTRISPRNGRIPGKVAIAWSKAQALVGICEGNLAPNYPFPQAAPSPS